MKIKSNFNLKAYNTFGFNVNCAYFISVNSTEELTVILQDKQFKQMPILFLGGGSNILLKNDFKGLVIHLNLLGVSAKEFTKNTVLVTGKSGENWHDFVQWNIEKGYGGLENLSLIPGNVGTAPMQNIGAYGREIKDCFYQLEALNLKTQKIELFSLEDCGFEYRESVFKNTLKNKYVIISVTFKLTTVNHILNSSYGAINDYLEQHKLTPSLKNIAKAVIHIRSSKLPNPKEIGNSGSFFKNPIVSKEQFEDLKKQFNDLKFYKIDTNNYKIPAGWMIEKAGWKGKQIGAVGVHKNQALVLVNYGNGTGQDVYDLSEKIIESINTIFGIVLEREVNIIESL